MCVCVCVVHAIMHTSYTNIDDLVPSPTPHVLLSRLYPSSTKKKGAISTECLRSEKDEEPKDCSKDLDDVTLRYKLKEASGPGTATDPAAGPPTAAADHDGRRLRRGDGGEAGRRLGAASSRSRGPLVFLDTTSSVQWGNSPYNTRPGKVLVGKSVSSVGVAPQYLGPLVNAPGHPASKIGVNVPFTVDASKGAVGDVTCSFTASVHDYAGRPFVNGSLAASTAAKHAVTLTGLADKDAKACSWDIARSAYARFAPTAMDAQAGLTAVDSNEHPYVLRISTTISVKGAGIVLAETVDKIICTPKIGGTLKKRIFCEANRGQYVVPAEDTPTKAALAHLTSQACRDVGKTSSSVNDGKCNAGNNVEGCWDGGDCCAFSCYEKNGQFVELAPDGTSWQFQHECFAINDTASCIDPTIKVFSPPYDYLRPAASGVVAFNGTGGAADDTAAELDGCAATIAAMDMGGLLANKNPSGASEKASAVSACIAAGRTKLCDEDSGDATAKQAAWARAVLDCGTTTADGPGQWKFADVLMNALILACTPANNVVGEGEMKEYVHGSTASGGLGFPRSLPRCPMRTKNGCQCKLSWTFSTHTYTKHVCANPDLGDGTFHHNDWCNIIRGSCDTEDGRVYDTETTGNPELVDDGNYWDDCGTNAVDSTTGKAKAGVEQSEWTAAELEQIAADPASRSTGGNPWEAMVDLGPASSASSASPAPAPAPKPPPGDTDAPAPAATSGGGGGGRSPSASTGGGRSPSSSSTSPAPSTGGGDGGGGGGTSTGGGGSPKVKLPPSTMDVAATVRVNVMIDTAFQKKILEAAIIAITGAITGTFTYTPVSSGGSGSNSTSSGDARRLGGGKTDVAFVLQFASNAAAKAGVESVNTASFGSVLGTKVDTLVKAEKPGSTFASAGAAGSLAGGTAAFSVVVPATEEESAAAAKSTGWPNGQWNRLPYWMWACIGGGVLLVLVALVVCVVCCCRTKKQRPSEGWGGKAQEMVGGTNPMHSGNSGNGGKMAYGGSL